MYSSSIHRTYTELRWQASGDYGWLSLKARIGKAFAMLLGQRTHLIELQEKLRHITISHRHFSGIQTVPVDQIQGSENKAQDFNAFFQPLLPKNRERWESVANAQIDGDSLPPIKVIQVGEIYFVRDGHHRVSVAKEFGVKFIEAEVIVWEIGTALPMNKFPANSNPAHQLSGQCVQM